MGLSVGVIGLGRIGAQWDLSDRKRARPATHLGSWSEIPDVSELAIADIDPYVTARVQESYPKAFPLNPELLAMRGYDIVSVATPAQSHHDIVMKLTASEHPPRLIFCEKPLATNLEEADEMVKDCAQRGVALAVNHTRRWDPIWRHVQECVTGDVTDLPNMAVAHFTGDLLNVGVHMADLVNWMKLGSCCEVFGHRDAEYLLFELDVFFQRRRIRVVDNGQVAEFYRVGEGDRYDGVKELRREGTSEERAGTTPMLAACSQLARCVLDGEKPLCTGDDALKALERVIEWQKKE